MSPSASLWFKPASIRAGRTLRCRGGQGTIYPTPPIPLCPHVDRPDVCHLGTCRPASLARVPILSPRSSRSRQTSMGRLGPLGVRLGNVAPTAGLERDVGQSTLTRFGLPIVTVRSGSNGRPPKSKDTCKPNTVTDPRLAFSISCANPENGTTSWRNRDGERRSDTQC